MNNSFTATDINYYNDLADTWQTYKMGYFIAVGVIHLYNMYDAYTVMPENLEMNAYFNEDKVGLNITYNF